MTGTQHILVVDDEQEIRALVRDCLEPEGYTVTTARDGHEMRRVFASRPVDLVILDLIMPGEGGLELTRQLRERHDVGIVILTGRGEVVDRVVGLEMGADDYLAKPFSPRELVARVRSVLRRAAAAPPAGPRRGGVARFAGWRLDIAAQRLDSTAGAEVPLTTGEFSLLAALVENPNRVMSREALLDRVRRPGTDPFDRSVDVLVLRLRRKIESDPAHPALIKTVRGGGYLFTPSVDRG